MDQTIATNDAVFTKVAELISSTADIPLEKVTPEARFQDLGMDSLDALALISDLEEEYGIKIPNQEILKIATVGQAVESISKRIQ
ncbi:MAG TPA: acyl carrier protein [Flavisolibacter sp.]|jgi:acyl carrier protein|nr:acyl carrier protein [Flavisolibacter sp.]